MNQIKEVCLSCKYFKLKEIDNGLCKIDRGQIQASDYPVKKKNETCDRWLDCGQHYYVRTGWIKARMAAASMDG